MRKLLLFVLCIAMMFAGVAVVSFGLLSASPGVRRFVIGGSALTFAGGHLLWTDFIAPRFGIKTWED